MRRVFKVMIGAAAGALRLRSGLLGLGNRSGDLVVLTFHRVVSQRYFRPGMVTSREAFRHLLDYLSRHATVIDLAQAYKYEANDGRLRVAITFDDGYRDNFDNALPELARHGFPATVFLATGLIDDPTRYLWWDQLDYALRDWAVFERALRRRVLDVVSGTAVKADENASRSQVLNELVDYLRVQSTLLRDRVVTDICELTQLAPSSELSPPRIMLSWDEVRQMKKAGVSFGGHTASHANLLEIGPEDVVKEVVHCRKRIEEETGEAVTSFAYPYGWYSLRTVQALREAGYRVAVTCNQGTFSRGDDPLQMPRISLSDDDLRGERVPFSPHMWNFQLLRTVLAGRQAGAE